VCCGWSLRPMTHLVARASQMNCINLWSCSRPVEDSFGTWGYLTIFVGSAVCGNVLSFMFSPHNAVGASGALFGLIGAYIAKASKRGALRNLQTALVSEPTHASTRLHCFSYLTRLNCVFPCSQVLLAFGFFFPFIDNWGHVGGLLGGYAVGTLVALVQSVQRLAIMRAGSWIPPAAESTNQ